LFGVRLSDNSIHFQFLTKEFIDQLLVFLDTEASEFSIPYASMSDDLAHFRRLLQKYANPFEQLQLRIHLIKGRVTKAIPGANLAVESTDKDTVCQVFVPWASSAFTVDSSVREEVRLNVLRGGPINPQQDGIALHPVILEAFKETQSSRLELGVAKPQKVNVGIRWHDQYATAPFDRYVYESEIAYVHRAGLRLTTNTKAEKTPNGYFHAMESEIFRPINPVALSGSTLKFLRLFRPGAILSLRSDWELPLSSFGDSLEGIGEAIDSIPDLCRSLGLALSHVALVDIKDEEFARTAWFLEALLLKGIPLGQLANGVIVGPAADLPLEQVPTVPISLSLPIALNWQETGIVIWTECIGDGFLHEGMLCGVRIRRQRSWKIERTSRYEKSIYPELWIANDWPAVPIGSEASGTQNWIYDPEKTLPLEAVIRKVERTS
jgi:hypothetical protein